MAIAEEQQHQHSSPIHGAYMKLIHHTLCLFICVLATALHAISYLIPDKWTRGTLIPGHFNHTGQGQATKRPPRNIMRDLKTLLHLILNPFVLVIQFLSLLAVATTTMTNCGGTDQGLYFNIGLNTSSSFNYFNRLYSDMTLRAEFVYKNEGRGALMTER